ncbi:MULTISPECIES: right-handed parallel beta-helix repeat-containing protein [unclassified Halorubrum]|uniref:right-handed parallel beta-helix repeat-containing protein n=1 Tax=unclassified Halorubrum TaxID=2642239 RepID=UPI0010F49E4C|nr:MULTISPECIES: right-handed parallel beta-helix repeat-containing protein [unclassified Halorubrum]TKX40958.1 right-handed parallel beta-helix repeat-containing protein [Halorubrum sp. ARQ200]TKX48259.1 right-handed parallel beta-helix repeat-containing protein [Halorubrum sp. ASP121]
MDFEHARSTAAAPLGATSRRSFVGGVGAATGLGSVFERVASHRGDSGGDGPRNGGPNPSGATYHVYRSNGKYRVASGGKGGVEFTVVADGNAEQAFQYAFDQVPADGGTVVADADEFRFGGPAVLGDGTLLTGSGGTRFVASATGSRVGFTERELDVGHDLIRVRGDDAAVTGIEFDADDTRLDNHAVQAEDCDGLLIADNRTVNGFQMALSFAGCENVVVRGNEVIDPNWYGITSRGARDDLDLQRSTDVLVQGNRVADVTFNNIAPYNVSNFGVVGNLCYRGGHSLIACSPSQQGTIVGNVCRDLELEPIAADPGGEAGLEIEYKETHLSDAVAGTDDETSLDVTVANNHVENCGVGFISRTVPVDEADEPEYRQTKRPYSFTVTGNAINGCDTGILIRSGAGGVVATNALRANDAQIDIRDSPFAENVQTELNVTRDA